MTAPSDSKTPLFNSAPLGRPRVLHCVSHLALGGAERVALTLMESLQGEFDFAIYAVRGLGDGAIGRALQQEIFAAGIPLQTGPRVPMRFGGMITGGIGLARAVRWAAPDLIHLHTEIPEASYAAMGTIRPQLRSIPLVRTIHNAGYWESWRPLGRWCDRRMLHAWIAGVSQGAVDAFRCLRHESGGASPPSPPEAIYNGVRPGIEEPSARKAIGHTLRVVFGGRLESEKGADLLPKILALAPPPPHQRAHLVIYGSGTYQRMLDSAAQSPPPGWTIEVRPPTPDFRRELATFDLLIVPSRYEGLALVAVEAAFAGIPILTTDAPGLRETVPAGYPWQAQAGDPASFAVMLKRAFESQNQWQDIASTVQAFARHRFDVKLMAEAYCTLYRRALMTKSRLSTNQPPESGCANTHPVFTAVSNHRLRPRS